MVVQERFHKELLDAPGVCDDLLVLITPEPFAGLQPIQRALARAALALIPGMDAAPTAGIVLAAQRGKQRIESQHVMVDDIFVAKTQADHSLSDQLLNAVLDKPLGCGNPESRQKTDAADQC